MLLDINCRFYELKPAKFLKYLSGSGRNPRNSSWRRREEFLSGDTFEAGHKITTRFITEILIFQFSILFDDRGLIIVFNKSHFFWKDLHDFVLTIIVVRHTKDIKRLESYALTPGMRTCMCMYVCVYMVCMVCTRLDHLEPSLPSARKHAIRTWLYYIQLPWYLGPSLR